MKNFCCFGARERVVILVLVLLFSSFQAIQTASYFRRIEDYLSRSCQRIYKFSSSLCNKQDGPYCCFLFSITSTCRTTTCGGPYDSVSSKHLRRLLRENTFCARMTDVGTTLCNASDSQGCLALTCLMKLACFNNQSFCDQEGKQQHICNLASELPEISDSKATRLIRVGLRRHTKDPTITCPKHSNPHCSYQTLKYRTIDGHCNNLDHPDWGKSFYNVRRLVPPAYQDGKGLPRTKGKNGNDLVSPRNICRTMNRNTGKQSNLSVFHMAWGQYLDHDIAGVPVIKLQNRERKCCHKTLKRNMTAEYGGPCFPIKIIGKEKFFTETSCMEFVRSIAAIDQHGDMMNPREQVNSLTSYIDASTVYGSTNKFIQNHRLPDGKLEMGPNNQLPRSREHSCKLVNHTTDYCLDAGDSRVNVFVGLGMIHTVFQRLHNALVDGLASVNPHWDGVKLFHEARKINAALHQHITYNEYLPSFLNDDTLTKYRLHVGDYEYDSSVDAGVFNAFSTAAFRCGHSQIQQLVMCGKEMFKTEDTLMRPHLVLTRLDDILEGVAFQRADHVDQFFVHAVTERLFETNRTQKDGLDLVSLNVQRGRDHGLAPYNEYREWCGLGRITSFDSDDILDGDKLQQVYQDVDDIDLFIGGMAEKHLLDSAVGPTFACLIGQQFHDLKFGDRFFYETTSLPEGFVKDQRNEIYAQTLSSIMCALTNVRQLQPHSLFIHNQEDNQKQDCRTFPTIDFTKWRD